MTGRARTPEDTYGPALQQALASFRLVDPAIVASRAAVIFRPDGSGSGRFEVPFFKSACTIQWPDGTGRRTDGEELELTTRILILHYLLTADGTPMGSRWVSFRNLPGGLGYDTAFQARSSIRLARTFGSDPLSFERASRALGGERLSFGSVSFMFRVLPRLWLAAVLYVADEEFPPDANVLFDSTASHYLPTEDLAVLAGLLASRLIRASRPS